jgi:SWI/SNF-related matrix-associated actin-dependent regulator of chromatin subfamily D
MWELRVEGRLIESELAPAAGATSAAPTAADAAKLPKRKFSSFFKSLVIELDKDLYGPDNHLVEVGLVGANDVELHLLQWHRTQQSHETDGFQVKRPGDRDLKCNILLLLDYHVSDRVVCRKAF